MTAANDPIGFTFTVPSDPRSLTVVRGTMDAVCTLAGFDDQTRYEIVLAVNEACSNVINHAYHGETNRPITLECSLSDEGLDVRVRDEGDRFDFDSVPDIDPTELRAGGRGVFLIRRYLDHVSCTARPEGGNELRLFKRSTQSID